MSGDEPENPYQAAARAARQGKASPVPKLTIAPPKAPYQASPRAADWVRAVHELHREEREQTPKAKANDPNSAAAVNKWASRSNYTQYASAPSGASSSTGARPPLVEGVRLSEALDSKEAYHRNVGGSFQTGFEPQRHSTFVLGRPVQVLINTVESNKKNNQKIDYVRIYNELKLFVSLLIRSWL